MNTDRVALIAFAVLTSPFWITVAAAMVVAMVVGAVVRLCQYDSPREF